MGDVGLREARHEKAAEVGPAWLKLTVQDVLDACTVAANNTIHKSKKNYRDKKYPTAHEKMTTSLV